MKALFTAFVMSTIISVGISSRPSAGAAPETASTLIAVEDASAEAALGGCVGSPPCCDFNDDGTCNLKMFCWLGMWTCP